MKQNVLFGLLVVLPGLAAADDGGQRVKGDELKALVTGAKVLHVSRYGSTRRWVNEADGTLVASTDNKNYGGATGMKGGTHPGKWSINAEDKYCLQIDWKREAEDWCASIVKGPDGAYYLNSIDPAKKIEFAH